MLTRNPKDTKWLSREYRRFIREMSCWVCHKQLLDEKPDYISHHHRHSGGKRPSDALLTAICLRCHNQLHANESRFNAKLGLREEDWLKHCMGNLVEYVEAMNINSWWVAINALQKVAEENE